MARRRVGRKPVDSKPPPAPRVEGRSFIEDLCEETLRLEEGQRITRAVIGAKMVYVELDDGGAGVAYANHEGGISRGLPGRLRGMRLSEVLPLLMSSRGLDVSLALATANALANRPREGLRKGDAIRNEEIGPEDVVVLIGYFQRYVEELKGKARTLRVLELARVEAPGVEVIPWWAFSTAVRDATWLIVTGSAIANHTINYILPLSGHVRNRVVIGPSTPLTERPFRSYGVRRLGGSIVAERETCSKVVEEGGGARELFDYGCLMKVYLDLV